jgi:uncharacterized repeat protein (TIGR01451 family)
VSSDTRRRFRPSIDSLESRRLLTVTVSEFAIPSHTGPLVAGPDGAVWFPQEGRSLGRMSTTGEFTAIDVGETFDVGEMLAGGLAVTPNGDIWFTTTNDNHIGRFHPGGGAILFDIPQSASSTGPWRLAAGPDGNVWFTEQTGNKIGRLTPQGAVTEFAVPTANAAPSEITGGPDGNVWFTEIVADKIGRITPDGQITEFAMPKPSSELPGGTAALSKIVAGPDGSLWFTEQSRGIGRITPDGKITEFTIPTQYSQPYGIAAGPDGNLWYTEFKANQISRITPAGTVTEFALPTPDSQPVGIVAGADGNLWFGEFSQPHLGKLNLAYTNLAIQIEAEPSVAAVGQDLTYTITVRNLGTTEATNVVAIDPLQAFLSTAPWGHVAVSQGTFEGLSGFIRDFGTLRGHFGTIAPGASATMTVTVRPKVAGTLSDVVTVIADESDRNPADDTFALLTKVAPSSSVLAPGGNNAPPAPMFTGEVRVYTGTGRRRKLIGFQISFSGSLDLASATATSHYRLTQPGRTRKSAPKLIPVKSVTVSPDGRVITLAAGKYDVKKTLQLTAAGLLGSRGQAVAKIVIRL